ncbi:MAG: decaprenyl-phosphate phosphoribosyltransferase [Thermodesulfobacteriota bacterium]|nr:decaprenyl-phosphate phosphoribosyltransferase [Thermodesulfobacteriota bacterium]
MTTFLPLFRSLRPEQWVKNVVIFAGVIFAQKFFYPDYLLKTTCAFILFSLTSGVVYIFNDIIDLERDKNHPVKKFRPLARGELKIWQAALFGGNLLLFCLILSFLLSQNFFFVVIWYLLLQMLYTISLKKIVILDVFAIACGFVLRVIAGAQVINIPISSWLLICTMLLALFLALTKRRHELILLNNNSGFHREILKEYSVSLLDQMIILVATATVLTYILYTMAQETVEKFSTDNLKYTIPFVLYGIFRYLYLIHQKGQGGRPEKVLLSDVPLLINIFLYGLIVLFILYTH